MNDERLRQRIAYLVQNGVVDDPLEDLARRVRILTYLVGITLTLSLVQLTANLI